jgi:O-antigen ligase
MSQQTGSKSSFYLNLINIFNLQIQDDPQRLKRVLVVSGVFFLSVLIGLFFPLEYLPIPIVLMVAVVVIIVYLRYPPLGLLALLFAAMLIRFEIGTGTGTSINFVVMLIPVLLGVWFADTVVRKRKISFVLSRPIWPLLALAIVSLLAFGIGQLPWFVFARAAPFRSQIAGLATFLLSVGAFFLISNLITEIRWLKRLTWMFLLIAPVYLLAVAVPAAGGVLFEIIPRGAGGSLFYVWLVAIAFSQVLLNRELSKFWRMMLIGLLVITLFVTFVILFDWKSGWVPAMVAVGVIIFIRYPRLGILLALISLIFLRDIPAQIIATDEYSYTTRIIAWEIIWDEIVKVNPLLGLGPANYYFYTPMFPILGYSVEFNSHNNYVDIVAQIGLLGLACLLWFAAELGVLGLGLLKRPMDGFSKAYVFGVLGGLAGTLAAGMLGDWVIPFVYNIGVRGLHTSVIGWIFLGGLIVIERIYSAPRSQLQEVS